MAKASWTGTGTRINLVGGYELNWRPSGMRLPNSWMKNEESAYVRIFSLRNTPNARGRVSVFLNSSDSSAGVTAGPEFKDEIETKIKFLLSIGAHSVAFEGISDSIEPYVWIPSNAADILSFTSGVAFGTLNLTLTLEYGSDLDIAPFLLLLEN